MESCKICNGDQDSKHYEDYNICTECSDLMEDLMSEYFLRTLKFDRDTSAGGFVRHLQNGKHFTSNYVRIRRHSKRHLRHMEEHVLDEIEKGAEGGKQRYLDRLHQTIGWLEKCPEFYNFYFKEYYVCPDCGASIFDHYGKQESGDWLMITCDKCNTVIKKYFSPKFTS